MTVPSETTRSSLDRLFAPKSIALIGATNKLTKWGGMILANVLTNQFKGRVFPVNPTSGEVLGLPAYPKVADIPGEVDLACIVTPAVTVSGLIDECGRKGIQTVLVITSDFSEKAPEGRKREEEIKKIAQNRGIHLIGPNSMGIVSAPGLSRLHDVHDGAPEGRNQLCVPGRQHRRPDARPGQAA